MISPVVAVVSFWTVYSHPSLRHGAKQILKYIVYDGNLIPYQYLNIYVVNHDCLIPYLSQEV